MDACNHQPMGKDTTKTDLAVEMKIESKVVSARTIDELRDKIRNYVDSCSGAECVNITAAVITVTESKVSV